MYISFLVFSLITEDFEKYLILSSDKMSKKILFTSSNIWHNIDFGKMTGIMFLHNTRPDNITMNICFPKRSCTNKIWCSSWFECYLSSWEIQLTCDEKMRRSHEYTYGAISYSVYPMPSDRASSAIRWWGINGSGRFSRSNHPISVARLGSMISGAWFQWSIIPK